MTVKELIKLLQTFPSELPVGYRCYSENVMLDAEDISIDELCEARPDGWIPNARPDMPTRPYLMFPGDLPRSAIGSNG